MAAPRTVLWKRDEHTEGKHLVLEQYLKAWFPILGMGSTNGRILFVDGFAGPGEYEGGEEGSPVVAMRVLAEHSARSRIAAEVVFHFIERDPARAQHLQRLVDDWGSRLPATARVHVRQGSFDGSMTEVLDELAEHGKRMAPALVMIDPFGVSGMPMRTIGRILANPRCEVYVSFMWEAMNRFVSLPEFEAPMDELFGSSDWRDAKQLAGDARRDFLHELYRRRLKEVGATQVVLFHLLAGNRLKYSIFFGTSHTMGSDRMKEAIWKTDPSGDYRFHGGGREQMNLLEPDYGPLRNELKERFEDAGWVSIGEIEEFVRSDATIYYAGQVRLRALKPMEHEGQLDVDEDSRRNRFTYPKGCRINFRPRVLRFL